MEFAHLPNEPTIPISPFTVDIPAADVEALKQLVKATRLPKATFENTQTKENYGITRDWLAEAKSVWETSYDWTYHQKSMHAIPSFKARVKNADGLEYTIYFAALFSKKPDAVPIIFSHGWPGCSFEFWELLLNVSKQYTPEEFPYHFIVPSLPGFAFSSPPPLDREFGLNDVAYLLDGLMQGLGFKEYMAQGGDIGSDIAFALAKNHECCKMIHVNIVFINSPPEGTPEFEASKNFSLQPDMVIGSLQPFGYALEQATRPSTVGMAIGCNPLSLLAWIGEKYREWTDKPTSLSTILTLVSLYWFTDTYPSSLYAYRYVLGSKRNEHQPSNYKTTKPVGYTLFAKELNKTPKHWVEAVCNLVWYKEHSDGGHFGAMEKPVEFLEDIQDFVKVAWKDAKA